VNQLTCEEDMAGEDCERTELRGGSEDLETFAARAASCRFIATISAFSEHSMFSACIFSAPSHSQIASCRSIVISAQI
jgi:hypothetical protein